METTIQVLQGGEVLYTLTEVIQAQYRDRIREAPALQFTTLYRRAPGITKDCVLFFGGNYFRISQLERSVSGGRYLLSVTAEHESVSLADDALELFSYTGAASGALTELLEGTGMRGVPETDGNVSIYMKNTNRRAVLLGIAAALGGEIDYRGHDILIVSNRGNTELTDILSRGKVSDLSVTVTGSEGDAYVLTMAGAADLSLGDAVLLRDTALGIDTQTRIIGIQYDPFQDHLRTFEAGKPVPSIVDFYQKTQKTASEADRKAQDAKDTADSAETKADAVEKALPDYQKKSDVSASIETYVNSEAGKASIVASLKGTYATEESLSGYVEKTTLTAEIGAYIDTEAGTAKIVSAASGTYQKKSDMSGYVQTSALNTSIGQYIDSAAGTAKIVSAASGTYQTKAGMSEYAKVSAVTSVEQSVSNVEAAITLSSSYTKDTIGTNVYALLQLVSNANSSTIKVKADKIDFTGFTTFVRPSDLASNGSTTIDGGRITTGTISADRIDVDLLKVKTIYGKDSTRVALTTSTGSTYVYIGADQTSSSANYSYVVVNASSQIRFTDDPDRIMYVMDFSTTTGAFRPNYSTDVTLGTSSYQWGALYAKKIYLNGTELKTGGNLAGTAVSMGGSTSYYIQATTSRQLCPSGTNSTYPFYLGTSSYYWDYAYIGSTAAYIGKSTSSKIGFFGTTPQTRQTVASSATVATLISALQKYGLIG